MRPQAIWGFICGLATGSLLMTAAAMMSSPAQGHPPACETPIYVSLVR
jgi:hypothetical protein